jgi:hypothetical protein
MLLIFPTIAVLQIHPVLANLPTVDAPVPWTFGNHTVLDITVRHDTTSLPYADHYVDHVEVDIDGIPHIINLTAPQQQYSFVVQYDMGQVTGTPTVEARAHCTYHGWGSFSPSVQVPEFSFLQLLSILAITSIMILLLRSKMHGLKKKIVKNTEGLALFLGDSKTIKA